MSKITSNGNITLIADKELHINTHIATKDSFDAETKEGDMHVGSKDCINTLKSKGLLNLIINNNISIESVTFDAEKVTIGTETEPPLNVTFTAHPPVNIKKLSFDISGSLKIDHNDNHYSLHVLGNINVTFASDNSLEFTDAA